VLRLSVAVVAVTPFNCRANVAVWFAVRMAVCVVSTAKAVAVKVAEVAPLATVTEAGTVTAVSLLVSVTVCPPLGAALPSVTVQESVPAPVKEALAQLNEDMDAALVAPLPRKFTVVVFLFFELLALTCSVAVAGPWLLGEN